MRRILAYLTILFAFLVAAGSTAEAQIVEGSASWDRDIQTLRNNIDPTFQHTYDNYLQYSPAVLMLGLKACGYKSRDNWGRMLTGDAFSVAIMAALVNATKYSVKRLRPDESAYNSFPSGHSATAFMTAALLEHEYGWRSPWWGFAGYSLATVTSMSRIMNNKHWMSDTFAGAVIGVGSVELGYFLTDLIFKEKGLYEGYEKPEFEYCSTDNKYYSIQAGYDRRFILGAKEMKASSEMPYRGSNVHLTVEIPLLEGSGVCVEGVAGSLLFKDGTSFNEYSGRVGLFWEREFAKVLEFEVQTLVGYAGHKNGGGIDVSAAASLNLVTGNNFKLRAITQWETFSYASRSDSLGKPFLNSILLGYSAAFFW